MTKDSSAKRKAGKRKPEKLSFTQDFIPIKNLEHGIIETTDGRYIKILEIEPINFMLRSEEEQYEIICSFASWLKISPVHLQFKSITRKADSDKHIAMLHKEMETEESEQCKKLSEGYIRLIKDVGSREALTRRFFLIFRYEELRRNENSDYGQICSTLLTTEQNARAYFMQCGNNILQPKDPDEATAEILYMFFNRRSCVEEPFHSRVDRIVLDTMAAKNKVIGIADAIFGLFRNDENEYTAENAYLTAESAQDGTFKFEKVPFGTWVVREIQSAKGFVLNEKAYPVTVSEDGDVVNIELENRYIRGNIEGTKLDEDGNVIAGAVFGLFREGETEFTEETAVRVTESDSTGKFRFEDIRYGKWIIRELKSATGYVLNKTPIEVEITEDGKTVFITVENKFICGDIKGYKVDEDGKSVVGALFGLFTEDDTEFTEENAVLTAVSDADGIFIFKNVRFGKWIVRELKPAEGFVLNETEFPVDITTDGAVIELKAENRHIYGAVHTTKVDKDYPDHLLTGAVFEVYRDVNENQQFDPDVDELVGTLSECEPGLYELAELRYGGYFLYEKQAPVNFVKDNGYYYFEIVTDGEMVKVENQAGIGFINAHMVGSLKIVKASSDGRVEGFSFRITGENYDEVFTTDANGEIFVENLRIGKYTVTEVEDSVSAGYKRPDPFEIELASDETLTVNVHNDKVTTDHPDSPKTGDNSHMALWLGLMLASLGVLIGTILYSRKKKHLAD